MEDMISVGIDIGTTTTQLVFSRICLETEAVCGSVPCVKIKSKEITYRSAVHETPLNGSDDIDGAGVRTIIEREYQAAGMKPDDVDTGAVIITGETARKRNAAGLIQALSDITGRFVVTEAGPDLESVLSGKGAGADVISRRTGRRVANMDIGGGTTNISVFEDGFVVDTACLEIGGRHINLDSQHRVLSMTSVMQMLLSKTGIVLKKGDVLEPQTAGRIAAVLAEKLAAAAGRAEDSDIAWLYTTHGLNPEKRPDIITVSGGVADCLWNAPADDYQYHDIGVFLGRALAASPLFDFRSVPAEERAAETVRATVIGAGNFSLSVSGSTIAYQNWPFPLKNIPVCHVDFSTAEKLPYLAGKIISAASILCSEPADEMRYAAAAFKGIACPSYAEIDSLAARTAEAAAELLRRHITLLVISESDTAKALGICLKRRLAPEAPFLCIDSIDCSQGDYIDIGIPVAHGKAVPVVIKTLLFHSQADR